MQANVQGFLPDEIAEVEFAFLNYYTDKEK